MPALVNRHGDLIPVAALSNKPAAGFGLKAQPLLKGFEGRTVTGDVTTLTIVSAGQIDLVFAFVVTTVARLPELPVLQFFHRSPLLVFQDPRRGFGRSPACTHQLELSGLPFGNRE